MNMEQARSTGGDESIVELRIAGHPVALSFAAEPDAAVAQRVRNCLIDSYICQNAMEHAAA